MIDAEQQLDRPPSVIKPPDLIRVGLVGAGAIGRQHARVLGSVLGIQLAGIHDVDPATGHEVSNHCGTTFYRDFERLLEESQLVVIATPTGTHFDLACQAIRAGKDVLIEKPLAESVERARTIVELSRQFDRRVVVGHVERFNRVVRWFQQNLTPGEILSINITRVGPKPPRVKDVGIVVDLAVHDIDLISHLCKSSIVEIHAVTRSTRGPHEDVAQINIKTHSGAVCAIVTNWLTPYKSRKIEIATAGAFYVGDLIAGTILRYEAVDGSGERYVVETKSPLGTEPLLEQSIAFINLVRGEESLAIASVEEGCRAVELALGCLGSPANNLQQ